ncbi:limbic system-associated membrane protein-like [Montipora capricornis]|uniref:limbic system-associated membrane protein-like n=1 Tax=Montipora capricornis TaxID=246305 RepID=UPI0035F11CDE
MQFVKQSRLTVFHDHSGYSKVKGCRSTKVIAVDFRFVIVLHPITSSHEDPPKITSISLNQTVDEGDVVPLSCTADGNPEPSTKWTRLTSNSIVRMPLTIEGKRDEGGYLCTADDGIGNSASSSVFITVQSYRPINTILSTNLTNDTVNLDDIFNLVCSADGNPASKYRLYQDDNLVNITDGQSNGSYLMSVSNRVRQVTYKCIPFNSFGDGPANTIKVELYYPPAPAAGEAHTLTCQVDGK